MTITYQFIWTRIALNGIPLELIITSAIFSSTYTVIKKKASLQTHMHINILVGHVTRFYKNWRSKGVVKSNRIPLYMHFSITHTLSHSFLLLPHWFIYFWLAFSWETAGSGKLGFRKFHLASHRGAYKTAPRFGEEFVARCTGYTYTYESACCSP